MHLSCPAKELKSAIALSLKAIPSRPTHPILSYFLLEAKDGYLTITGFNYDTGVSMAIEAEIETEGTFLTPANKMANIVRCLSEDTIELEIDGNKLLLKTETKDMELAIADAKDYIALPKVDSGETQIPLANFMESLAKASISSSPDITKQVISGIRFKLKDGELSLFATDGHKMSKIIIPIETELEDFEVVLAKDCCAKLLSAYSSFKFCECIYFKTDGNLIEFRLNQLRIFSRLLVGTYPNIDKLIQTDFVINATVAKRQLAEALEIAKQFTDESNTPVVLDFSTSSLKISSVGEIGKSNLVISAESNESIRIRINAEYLRILIKAIAGTTIKFFINDPVQPILIKDVAAGDLDTHLIMPLRDPEA